jgi:outer membrane protein
VRVHEYARVVVPALVGLVLLGGRPLALGAQAPVRIGVVDVQNVLNQSQKGLAAKQKLDQERAARQKELDARQQEVMKLQGELEKQAPLLSEQAKREKAELIQRKQRDAVRIAEDANRDLEKREREAVADIGRQIVAVIQEFGNDQGYTLILERNATYYNVPAADITAEIIKRFDAKQK